jgi:hypothetical protein
LWVPDESIAYRASHHPLNPPPFQSDPREIYHSLCPFSALSPVPHEGNESSIQQQKDNEAVYRQLLVQGVLAILLPTEDLENDCLTAIVGQIFSEMILGGGIGGKASEPWLLWEGITKVVEVVQERRNKPAAQVDAERSPANTTGSASSDITGRSRKRWGFGRSIQNTFWLVLQYVFLALTAARFLVISVARSTNLPSRMARTMKLTGSMHVEGERESATLTNPKTTPRSPIPPSKQAILRMKIWSCAAELVDLNIRMPWLSATISMLQWAAITGPGEVGNTDGMIDK